MDIFTVSFFGHKTISNTFLVGTELEKIIHDLIISKEYVEFLVGRSGDFDILAASTIRHVQRALDRANSSLVLILPRMTAEYRNNTENFDSYYDEIEICTKSEQAHFKASIQIRNQYMVERSDLIVCRIEHNSGGAFQTVKYAKKLGVKIINIT